MDKKWDYSELSRNAKLNGGPEKYIELIKEYSYREGVLNGKEEGKTEVLISERIALGLSFLGYAGYKAYTSIKKRKEKDALIKQKAEVKDAEAKLTKVMKISLDTEECKTDVRDGKVQSEK